RIAAWQSERDDGHAGKPLPTSSAHCNRHVLLSVDTVRTRRGIGAGLELSIPEHLSGSGVECSELMVLCGADEDQSTRRCDGAAKVGGPGGRNSTGGQLRMLAEWDPPSKVARVQIDRGNTAPRRFHGGKILFLELLVVGF